MQRDYVEGCDALLVKSLLLRSSTGPLALGRGTRDSGRPVLETHVCNHLAEKARRFDRRLRVFVGDRERACTT